MVTLPARNGNEDVALQADLPTNNNELRSERAQDFIISNARKEGTIVEQCFSKINWSTLERPSAQKVKEE